MTVEYGLAAILLLALVAAIVVRPLVLGPGEESDESVSHEELEAAKEAKYREIRDAELDFRTGKLSETDYREVDRALRSEAIELLRRLDAIATKEGPR